MQQKRNDLVLATHGRSVFIMDDMTPVQQLQQAVGQGTWLFQPMVAFQWTLHGNDEGTYTNFAADNPPTGVVITFYQSAAQKSAPALEILNASGRVVRNVSGTHKVGGKDVPYITNKVGLNRFTWDFSVNGPVRWNAGNDFSKGPENGPAVVPGNYAVRMTLSGHTYVQHFSVEPDPRSHFTQADYQRSFDEAMRQMARLSQVDQILNDLADLEKAMNDATSQAKKANNATLVTKLNAASTERKALFDTLAVNIRGEGTEDEGKLHEDLLGAFFGAQGLITPAVSDFLSRVEGQYRDGIGKYNAFVANTLPPVNAALQQAGMKPLTPVKQARAL
jgi:hypothetical protein